MTEDPSATTTPAAPVEAGKENEEVILGEDGKPLSKAQLKKLQKKLEKERQKKETADRLVSVIAFIMLMSIGS